MLKKKAVPKISVGTAHFLRNGAGAHKDKKKEQNRTKCRRKVSYDDTYFMRAVIKFKAALYETIRFYCCSS